MKLLLLYKGKRIVKWKTSVKNNTLVPVFDEPFSFSVSGLDMSDITLQVMIMDHNKVSRNEHIGTILIGERVEDRSGKIHWAQMMASPNESTNHWHTIMPAD